MEQSLLEKLTVAQLAKKYPTFYEILKFINLFRTADRSILSWAIRIHFTSYSFKIRFNTPRSPGFLTKIL
jgi:hypothetical protein